MDNNRDEKHTASTMLNLELNSTRLYVTVPGWFLKPSERERKHPKQKQFTADGFPSESLRAKPAVVGLINIFLGENKRE